VEVPAGAVLEQHRLQYRGAVACQPHVGAERTRRARLLRDLGQDVAQLLRPRRGGEETQDRDRPTAMVAEGRRHGTIIVKHGRWIKEEACAWRGPDWCGCLPRSSSA